MMMVLGIEDPWIWGVYVLLIVSTLMCCFHINVRSIWYY